MDRNFTMPEGFNKIEVDKGTLHFSDGNELDEIDKNSKQMHFSSDNDIREIPREDKSKLFISEDLEVLSREEPKELRIVRK